MYLTLVSCVNESSACYPFPVFPMSVLSLLLTALLGWTYQNGMSKKMKDRVLRKGKQVTTFSFSLQEATPACWSGCAKLWTSRCTCFYLSRQASAWTHQQNTELWTDVLMEWLLKKNDLFCRNGNYITIGFLRWCLSQLYYCIIYLFVPFLWESH